MFTKIKNVLLDIFFPPLCFGCQKYLENRNKYVCGDCLRSIKLNNTLFCPVCQARLPENKRVCSHGPEKAEKFPYILGAATTYDSKIIQDLIWHYKYKSFEQLSSPLGEILINYLDSIIRNSSASWRIEIRNFLIIPIPLHLFREKKRGFNQSELLAKIISKNFSLEFIDALTRVKNNPPQAKSKDRKDRQKNISEAFQIIDPERIKKIENKNIILIDDVYTSGSTMSEAAQVLKKNGAGKIIALVVAKA